jgi:hypothetical protein
MRDEILELLNEEKPTLLLRKKTGDRILNKIIGFVETFINGIVGVSLHKPLYYINIQRIMILLLSKVYFDLK